MHDKTDEAGCCKRPAYPRSTSAETAALKMRLTIYPRVIGALSARYQPDISTLWPRYPAFNV
ncbi:hypothetical protein, partial [Mesorhizobium sp. M3A.F.Ca.ET.174.01.1.1]|uniref:hypothetical protein n=1 Tax=Mesorhizobium sp. M3A.F.Ca.ET.174.01.1.1 TaxID=2563944 RepID=UPI001AED32F0